MQHLPLLGILRAWEVSMNKTIQASPQQETKETNILLPHDASPWWYELGSHTCLLQLGHILSRLHCFIRPQTLWLQLTGGSTAFWTTCAPQAQSEKEPPLGNITGDNLQINWLDLFCAFKLFFTDFPSFVHALIASNHYNHLSFIMSLLQVSYFKISSCHSTVSVSEYKSWTRMNFINE